MKEESKHLPEITSQELAKVPDNILNTAQLKMLLGGTPKNHVYTRPAKGGGTWSYVTGTFVKKQLNLLFGWDWDFEVIKFQYELDLNQCIVLGKLTCRSNGRTVVKNQFGRADIKIKKATGLPLDLGNDLKAATTDALKKCASELGIASDVYNPNEFKAIKIIDAADFEQLPLELIEEIKDINDSFDLMEFANSRENKKYSTNKEFIKLINECRQILES